MVLSLRNFPLHNMKHARLLTLLSLTGLLAACSFMGGATGGSSSSAASKVSEEASIPTEVKITPTVVRTPVTEGGLESTQNTFSLSLSMMPTRTVSIPLAMETSDGEMAMNRLNPGLYEGSDVLASYEYYYAGGGFQVVVRKAAGALVFEKRNTSEGSEEVDGGCDKWVNVGTLPIDAQTKIVIDDAALEMQDHMVIGCKM